MTMIASELEQCIEHCTECYRVCEETKVHCLKQGGKHAEHEHMNLMADCAKICALSADYMIRQSPRHTSTCSVCAQVCKACADSCGKMGDDEQMRRCAEVCQRCADSCAAMARA